jgi:hypothetical protein
VATKKNVDLNNSTLNNYLLCGYSLRQVSDDPPEEPVMRGEADEELELVVFAETVTRRFDSSD